MLAVAEMYIKGVSTREVEAVMREFGIESISSSQVSRAAALLDDELEAWRNRELGEIRYLKQHSKSPHRRPSRASLKAVSSISLSAQWSPCALILSLSADIVHLTNTSRYSRMNHN